MLELYGHVSMVPTLVGSGMLKMEAAGRSLGEWPVLAIPLLGGQCLYSRLPGSRRGTVGKQDRGKRHGRGPCLGGMSQQERGVN